MPLLWEAFVKKSNLTVAFFYLLQGLKLRMEHFHCFSDHGHGGHYHYDVTPDDVSYLGYFNVGDVLYRVDEPEIWRAFGILYGGGVQFVHVTLGIISIHQYQLMVMSRWRYLEGALVSTNADQYIKCGHDF